MRNFDTILWEQIAYVCEGLGGVATPMDVVAAYENATEIWIDEHVAETVEQWIGGAL